MALRHGQQKLRMPGVRREVGRGKADEGGKTRAQGTWMWEKDFDLFLDNTYSSFLEIRSWVFPADSSPCCLSPPSPPQLDCLVPMVYDRTQHGALVCSVGLYCAFGGELHEVGNHHYSAVRKCLLKVSQYSKEWRHFGASKCISIAQEKNHER